MIGDLIGSLGGLLAAVAAIVAALGAVWAKGRSDGRAKELARRGDEYRETVERAKNADLSRGDGADDVEWLRRRGER